VRALLVLATSVALLAGCGGRGSRHTLLTGQTARFPQVGVRCEASSEGGEKNLFCSSTRLPAVTFYADTSLVWLSTDDAVSFRWTRGRSQPTDASGGTGVVTLRPGDRIDAPGAATTCGAEAAALRCAPEGGGRYTVVFERDRVLVVDTQHPAAVRTFR
jgi:hypothetical protein